MESGSTLIFRFARSFGNILFFFVNCVPNEMINFERVFSFLHRLGTLHLGKWELSTSEYVASVVCVAVINIINNEQRVWVMYSALRQGVRRKSH